MWHVPNSLCLLNSHVCLTTRRYGILWLKQPSTLPCGWILDILRYFGQVAIGINFMSA